MQTASENYRKCFYKVVPICGDLKFKDDQGFYRHIERLMKCQMRIYKMVERFIGEGESELGPGKEAGTGRGARYLYLTHKKYFFIS